MRGFGGVSSLCSEKGSLCGKRFSLRNEFVRFVIICVCVFCVGQTLRELGKHSVVYTVLNFTHKEPLEIGGKNTHLLNT